MKIVPYIAAAAAKGFEESLNQPAPRSPKQWVHHCQAAADLAAAEIMANPPIPDDDESPRTIERWLHEMNHGPAVPLPGPQPLSGEKLKAAAHAAAARAFRACLPLLTGRTSVKAYIACVSHGTLRNYLDSAEARAMMYTAQLALSAYKLASK